VRRRTAGRSAARPATMTIRCPRRSRSVAAGRALVGHGVDPSTALSLAPPPPPPRKSTLRCVPICALRERPGANCGAASFRSTTAQVPSPRAAGGGARHGVDEEPETGARDRPPNSAPVVSPGSTRAEIASPRAAGNTNVVKPRLRWCRPCTGWGINRIVLHRDRKTTEWHRLDVAALASLRLLADVRQSPPACGATNPSTT